MVTIKEYADSRGLAYETVRAKVARYANELDGHTFLVNRVTRLDDYAVDFLDGHKQAKTFVVDPSPEYEREIAKLKAELEAYKNKTMQLLDENNALLREKAAMIEDGTRAQVLLEAKQNEADRAEKELQETKQKLLEAEKEASSYHKSWFGLYKKIQ